MKDVEIFFFDVDGTLLNNNTHTISESTTQALIDLKAKGYKIALCTGRNLEGIKELDLIDLVSWDAFVLANGSQVLDQDLNVVEEILFDPELISKLDEHLTSPLLIEGDENFISKKANDKIMKAFNHFGIEPYDVIPYTGQKVYNIICYDFDDIQGDLLLEVREKCQTFHDQLGNMEMIAIESGKHNGVARANKFLGTSHYAGFGDGENDVEFLKHAPIAVAMGNGTNSVKHVSDYVTTSVDDDGIYKALLHFGVL